MPEARRVVKREYLDTAFDGEGARRTGGRWNSPGRAVVYAADSPALAMLEMLVHVEASLMPHYVVIPVRFRDDQTTAVDAASLPPGWGAHPGPAALRRIGDAWLARAASLALRVPAAVVPFGWSYLLNPAHPDFADLEIGEPAGFRLDARLRNLRREP